MSADATVRAPVLEVLGNREFGAFLGSVGLSILGDQVARIAVALLVFQRTGSAFASSATYACSYLTWLVGGPLLSALADRHRRRRLMVLCDLLRAGLVAVLVVPHIPLWLLFAVLLAVGMLAPPFDAAKAALLPEVLEGDRYVTGSAVINTVAQGGQVLGFLVGGLLVAATGPRPALAVDAATFLVSALLLSALVRERPVPPGRNGSLARDTREGLGLVARTPVLRRMLGFGLLGMFAAIVPEGMAVPVAHQLGGGAVTAGVLTATVPAGFLVGSFLLLRVSPERRLALLPTLAVLSCLPLLLTPVARNSLLVGALWVLAGAGSAYQLVANATYMTSAPSDARGRVYGVAVTGLMATQGIALLAAGAVAEAVDPRVAVAAGAAASLLLLTLVALTGGSPQEAIMIDRGQP